MLYGSKEKLHNALKDNPNIFESISEQFESDPEISKALEDLNFELTSGDISSDDFTTNAGEMIDFTSSQYDEIVKLINEMKKINFNIVNSISLTNEVSLNKLDLDKINSKVNEDIKRLEEVKLQIDDLVAKIVSSTILDAKSILKDDSLVHIDGKSSDTLESKDMDGLLEDNQYVLGKTPSGDYYLSISSNLDSEEVPNIKNQISSLRPDLENEDFKIDNGKIILSDNYEIVLNGYVKKDLVVDKPSNEELIEKTNGEDNIDEPLNVENKSIDDSEEGKEKVNEELLQSVKDENNFNGDTAIEPPSVFEIPLDDETSKPIETQNSEISSEPTLQIDENDIQEKKEEASNLEITDNSIFNIKPNLEEVNSGFTFGKKDDVYYLVVKPDTASEDVKDIIMRIAESKPELAGKSFAIDYGSILSDSSFETILSGFIKQKEQIDSNDFIKIR